MNSPFLSEYSFEGSELDKFNLLYQSNLQSENFFKAIEYALKLAKYSF